MDLLDLAEPDPPEGRCRIARTGRHVPSKREDGEIRCVLCLEPLPPDVLPPLVPR